jgi:hypothetical protein
LRGFTYTVEREFAPFSDSGLQEERERERAGSREIDGNFEIEMSTWVSFS